MGTITEWIASFHPTIIFGAGKQAAIVYKYCRLHGKNCIGFMTTENTTRHPELPDERSIPHYYPDNYEGDRGAVDIVVAIGNGATSICEKLRVKGYGLVFSSDNWMEGNELLRYGGIRKRKFCDEFANFPMNILGHVGKNMTINLCCEMPNHPRMYFADTPGETFARFFDLRNRCISEYVMENANVCGGGTGYDCVSCERYHEQDHLWNFSPFITWVNLTVYPSPCQCKCIYCNDKLYQWEENEDVHVGYKKLFKVLEYGKSTGLIGKDAMWQVSPGEITIHPYKKNFLDLVRDRHAVFFTNGFLFDKDIAQHLAGDSNSQLNISIDSGTSQTWEKIKRRNNFNAVKKNLIQYGECCGKEAWYQLTFKYVLLPGINDNVMDYDKLIEFLNCLSVRKLMITRDLNMKFRVDKEYHDALMKSAAVFMRHCIDHNVEPQLYLYSPEEKFEIQRRM